MEYTYVLTFCKGSMTPTRHEVKGYYAFVELCRDRVGMGWILFNVELISQ